MIPWDVYNKAGVLVRKVQLLKDIHLRLLSVRKVTDCTAPFKRIRHRPGLATMLVVLHGKLQLIHANGQTLHGHAGNIVLLSPTSPWQITPMPGDSHPPQLYQIVFAIRPVSDVSVQDSLRALGPWDVVCHPSESSSCQEMVSHLFRLHRTGLSEDSMQALGLLLALLHKLGKQHKSSVFRQEDNSIQSIIQAIKADMELHFWRDITLRQLADIAGISTGYFSLAFKRETGTSPLAFLTGLRMQHAREQLLHAGMKVKEVAHAVGYQDEFYFSRLFKSWYGISPAQFIAGSRRKIVTFSFTYSAHLLALGIVPLATFDKAGHAASPQLLARSAWYGREDKQEQLALLRPHLIVCKDSEQNLAAHPAPEHWARIAWDSAWKQQFEEISDHLGVADAARKWLDNYARKAQHVKTQISRLHAGPTLVIRIRHTGMRLYTHRNVADVLYEDLGFERPFLPTDQKHFIEIDLPSLLHLKPAQLFIMVEDNQEARQQLHALQTAPQWRRLAAVQAGKAYVVPAKEWMPYSPLAHDKLLQRLLRLMRPHG